MNLEITTYKMNDSTMDELYKQKSITKDPEELKKIEDKIEKRIQDDFALLSKSVELKKDQEESISTKRKREPRKIAQLEKKQKLDEKNSELSKEIEDFKEFYKNERENLEDWKIGAYIDSEKMEKIIQSNLEELAQLKSIKCKLSYYKSGKIKLDKNTIIRSARGVLRTLGFSGGFIDEMECLKIFTDFLKFYYEKIRINDPQNLFNSLEKAVRGLESLKTTYTIKIFKKAEDKCELIQESINNLYEIIGTHNNPENDWIEVALEEVPEIQEEFKDWVIIGDKKTLTEKPVEMNSEKVLLEEETEQLIKISDPNQASQNIVHIALRIEMLLKNALNDSTYPELNYMCKTYKIIKDHLPLLFAGLALKRHEDKATESLHTYIENFCQELKKQLNHSFGQSNITKLETLKAELYKLPDFEKAIKAIEKERKNEETIKIGKTKKEQKQRELKLQFLYKCLSGTALMTLGYLTPIKFSIAGGDKLLRSGLDDICNSLLKTKDVREDEIAGLRERLMELQEHWKEDYATNLSELYSYLKKKHDKGEKMSKEERETLEKVFKIVKEAYQALKKRNQKNPKEEEKPEESE